MVVVVVILGDDSLCPFQTSEPPPSIPRITRASSSSVGREAGGGGGRETVGSWWTLQRETVSPSLSPGARKGESSSRARGGWATQYKRPGVPPTGHQSLEIVPTVHNESLHRCKYSFSYCF